MKSSASLPHDWREGRRLRAFELSEQGWKQKDIAAALGVTHGAVSQWLKRARLGGKEALCHRRAPGPAGKLTAEQRAQIPALLARGALAFGFGGAVWTTRRVAEVLRQEFGVSYHPAHVSRLLRSIGWTPQKPITRATQRNEQAIQEWSSTRWPALQAKPKPKGTPSSG